MALRSGFFRSITEGDVSLGDGLQIQINPAMQSSSAGMERTSLLPPVKIWNWQGHRIAYRQAGRQGPPLVLVHGFGASSIHWRKNLPQLSEEHQVWAIDLLGFGASAKPQGMDYTFDTWAAQLAAFTEQVVGAPSLWVGNSIGCIVCLQAAVDHPDLVRGLSLMNCSLRLLHEKKRQTQPWLRQVGTPLIQKLLTQTPLGRVFFDRLRNPRALRKVLLQAYAQPEAVTDELVHLLLEPAAEEGALEVFLAFINYASGPLAEDLLPKLSQQQCPVQFLWGEKDPWEPLDLGRTYASYPCVEEFIALSNAGHCPQDEVPEVVNGHVLRWAQRVWAK
jgi:pimeloyl-ACP methyl ester carboxylesterase